jgi:hypothetical protein
MRNIDPTSIYGAYAEGAIERWVVPMEKNAAAQPAAAPGSAGGKGKGNTAMGSTDKSGN